jgi:hypothetical protein
VEFHQQDLPLQTNYNWSRIAHREKDSDYQIFANHLVLKGKKWRQRANYQPLSERQQELVLSHPTAYRQ